MKGLPTTLALGLAVLAMAVGSMATAPTEAGAHANFHNCGDTNTYVYNVRAQAVGCRKAKRVARYIGTHHPDKTYRGFRCRITQRHYDYSSYRCVKRKPGTNAIIRFDAGG